MHTDAKRKWLLSCLRAQTDEAGAIQTEQLSDPDWGEIIQLAARHGVTPLLYLNLKAAAPTPYVPVAVMHQLREAYLGNAVRNTRLYYQLARLLTALQKDNIAVIVLKGAHLAETVYGNVALRPMGDLDLMVRKSDLSRTAEKLVGMGYSFNAPADMKAYCEENHHLPAFLAPGGPAVEIHWLIPLVISPSGEELAGLWRGEWFEAFEQQVNSPSDEELAGVWKRCRWATIAGVETLVLSPEDLLLHLCMETSHHHSGFVMGLSPFCDISATIRRYQNEIDWKQLQFRAQEWGAGKYVHLTLWLARDLLEAPVPGDVLEFLKPKDFDARWVAVAKEQVLSGRPMPLESRFINGAILLLWSGRSLGDKLSVLLTRLFLPGTPIADKCGVPPHSKRVYLLRVLRLLRRLPAQALNAWRFISRGKEASVLLRMHKNRGRLMEWLHRSDSGQPRG